MQQAQLDDVRNVLTRLSAGTFEPIEPPSVERAEIETLRGQVWFLQKDLDQLHGGAQFILGMMGWATFGLCTAFLLFGVVAGLAAGVPLTMIAATTILLVVGPVAQWMIVSLFFKRL